MQDELQQVTKAVDILLDEQSAPQSDAEFLEVDEGTRISPHHFLDSGVASVLGAF